MSDRSLAPVAEPWPPTEEVAGVVEAVASSAGHAVSDLSVELAPGEWGGRAYACTLTTGDPVWDQPLIARAAGPGDALHGAAAGGEAAWHAHLASHGVAVPPIVAVSEGDGLAATVMQRTHEHSLIEVISANPTDAAALLARAGEVHVAIHAVPTEGAPAGLGPSDVVAASAEPAQRFDLAAEHSWLAEHRPPSSVDPVVCHGNLQPSQLRLDPAEPEHAVVTTWTQVTVDARERDVAQTSLALWSIPYVAKRRSERMMLKMFRDTLVANYRDGYAAEAGVDLDAALLAWWRAAHVLDWSIRLARSQQAAEPDPWDPVHLVAKPQSFAKDLRGHFWELTREAGG